MKKKTIWLTESQIGMLEILSLVMGEKQSVIIRRALDEYLEKQPPRVEWRIRNGDSDND